MPEEDVTTVFSADITDFKAAMQEASRRIKMANADFNSLATSMDEATSAQDMLNAQIQKATTIRDAELRKLQTLEVEYNKVVAAQGANSRGAEELYIKLKNQESAYNKAVSSVKNYKTQLANLNSENDQSEKSIEEIVQALKKEARALTDSANESKKVKKLKEQIEQTEEEYSKALQEANGNTKEIIRLTQQYDAKLKSLNNTLDDTVDKQNNTNESAGKFKSAMGGIGKGLAGGLVAIGGAAVAGAASFLSLAESTREYRSELAKLESTADATGTSFENIKEQYQSTVAITGDESAAIEGYNNLMTLAKGNEDFISTVSKSFEGASIKWKDTLKFEGLADSLQETLATGKGVGQFSELLERNGVNIDRFNAGLDSCSTEMEKQNYIADELAKLGLAEISDAYKEQNKDLYEASLAQQNLNDSMAELGAIAEPLKTILNNSLAKVLQLITPWLEKLTGALQQLVAGDITGGLSTLGEMVTAITDKVSTVLPKIVDTVSELLPTILPMITDLLLSLVQSFIDFAPTLFESFLQLIGGIVEAIPPVITKIVEKLPELLQAIADALTEMIPTLFEYAESFLNTIVEAIPPLIDKLVEALPQIIETIIGFILTNLPVIQEKGIQLFSKIIDAIGTILPALIRALPKIITTIINYLADNLPELMQMGVDMFMQLVKSIPQILGDLGTALGDIVEAIFDAFEDIDLKEVGKNIIDGLIDGLASMGDALWKSVQDLGSNIEESFKDFFGIASPSKLMRKEVGYNIGSGAALGIADGFDDNFDKVKKNMLNSVESLNGSQLHISGSSNNSTYSGREGKTVNVNYTVHSPNPMNRAELWNQSKRLNKLLKGV